jgi:hypothetical protein
MRSDRLRPPETGRVILFRPRQTGSAPPGKMRPHGPVGVHKPLWPREDDEDQRHRRLVHTLGLAYCLILAVTGVWLADEFTEMRRIQDCVSSGRSGCIPLNVAGLSSWR